MSYIEEQKAKAKKRYDLKRITKKQLATFILFGRIEPKANKCK